MMKSCRKFCSRLFSKQLALVMAVVLFLPCISGCKSIGSKKEITAIKIGIAVYDQYDVFISSLVNKFNEFASDKSASSGVTISVEIMNSAGSQLTQNNQVKSMINSDYDIICVNLVDRTEPSYIIELAKETDTPVIFFNRELVSEDLERWEKLYYVGAKAYESGVLQGELISDYWNNNADADKNKDGIMQYIIIEGEAGHQDAIVRTEYATDTLTENGILIEKIDYAIANWNRDQAKAKMKQILAQNEAAEIIICNNDMMAIGVIDAYEETHTPRSSRPAIFGIDGVKETLPYLEEGKLTATVINDYVGQADAMMELAFSVATGTDLTSYTLEDGKYIWIPYTK